MNTNTEKVIVITDVWRDVDDALALCLLHKLQMTWRLQIEWIITSHIIAKQRAILAKKMHKLLWSDSKIIEGNSVPLGQNKTKQFAQMKKSELALFNRITSKLWINESDTNWDYIWSIWDLIEDSSWKVNILCLAVMTDLASFLLRERKWLSKKIKNIIIMGNAIPNREKLIVPNYDSFNLREDKRASEIVFDKLKNEIPMTFVWKHAAYKVPLSLDDFRDFKNTGHPIWEFLFDHVVEWVKYFAEEIPDLFIRRYAWWKKVDLNNPLKEISFVSFPYDPLAVLALTDPELFRPDKIWIHRLIWVRQWCSWLNYYGLKVRRLNTYD